MKTFEELGVSEEIRRAIEEMGFEKPMPVQEEVIPYLLGTRNDVIALAQTGTGKTAAFGIPLIQRIDTRIRQTQAIVLSPTRELCLQIADDLKDFSKYIPDVHIIPVYGGANIETQIKALNKGVHIIVATPGRLIDLMKRGVAKLGAVGNVVLDEADEMLNMGFSEDLNTILAGVPEERNTLLFSATMSKEIEKIARTYLHEPKEIVVGSRNEGAENVNHIYYMVSAKDKYLALKRIVDFHPRIFAIIFCRTKVETQDIADKLIKDGYNAESLHGDLSQQQRDLTMQKFRQHLTQLLVATDVAARGLDVDDLTHVINYGMPDDIENYIHRSGRTGRAGKKGTSIAIVHTREKGKIRQVERQIGKNFQIGEMPSPQEICKKQLFKVMDQIVKTDVDEGQIEPFMQDINRFFEFVEKDDLIKKIVSVEFGKFLAYYANAPEVRIETGKKSKDETRKERKERGRGGRRQTEEGYCRLFINLGKKDGFFPGEVMQFINRNVKGHVAVGHIDLQNTFSFIEVDGEDADRVMRGLSGVIYKGREVRCNNADEQGRQASSSRKQFEPHGKKRDFRPSNRREERAQPKREKQTKFGKEDWMKFLNPDFAKGHDADFEEEGWARRRPKKKK
ncbi:DEAD/DEAH box helicase [Prevotella sp. OH937_COT-195]|uniref:DEAD/DEAH box helicase n=1 Tax=Prevotella sp. OH937_COT-195 TaxID=2491051 RepID=UPI000F652641|nr:DEAD/DEAH box helicase [Prevotella sp. OH937_COT-195]RRC98724.1 DEAD/DEAH box helicase [Prevotella sp. OH937_COT-195]